MYLISKSLSIAKALLPTVYDTSINRNFHFAFAFRRNKLLAIGTNNMSVESARVLKFIRRFNIKQHYLFRHAEVDAISRLWSKTYIDYKIRLVVIRLNRHLNLGDSQPCKHCQSILDALGVEDIYWSNSDDTFSSKKNKVEFKC